MTDTTQLENEIKALHGRLEAHFAILIVLLGKDGIDELKTVQKWISKAIDNIDSQDRSEWEPYMLTGKRYEMQKMHDELGELCAEKQKGS